MQRHTDERGAALILLLGITATLAILAGASVMVLANQMHATAADRSDKTSLYYAEAALDSAVNAVKSKTDVSATGFLTPAEMAVNYNAAYPSGPAVTYRVYDNQTPVNTAIDCDQGQPGNPTDPDDRVWLEVTTSYLGKASRLRVLVVQTVGTVIQAMPKAALFSDQNIYFNGSSDAYAVNDDFTAYVPDPPGNYATKIMAGGNVKGNGSTNLAAPGSSVQSIGVQANGTVSGLATGSTGVTKGGVPALSDYFNQADQAALMFEAQTGGPTAANATNTAAPVSPTLFTPASILTIPGASLVGSTYTFANDLNVSGNLTLKTSGTGVVFPAGTTFRFKSLYVNGTLTLTGATTSTATLYVNGNFTVGAQNFGSAFRMGKPFTWTDNGAVSPTKFTPTNIVTIPGVTYDLATKTYTSTNDLAVNGSLTLNSGTGTFAAGTIFKFKSLYVKGSLTLNGSTTTNTTALNVRDGFTISGPTGVQQFGPIYVGGECNWSGGNAVTPLKVQTTDYTDPDPDQYPGPLWTGFLKCPSGVYSHILGPTWVVGNAGTSDVAIQFSPSSSSLVLCPLMATTEKIETSGPCSFGTLDKPMVLYMVCDNDNLYTNTCVWNSSGTFTGLMVLMEAAINPGGGYDGAVASHANIVGALFCIKDVTISSNTSICYNQKVLENLQATAITTTTTKTNVVPGTWQELSASSN